MSRSYRIAALPGEGIGPEVVDAALTILQEVAKLHGFSVAIAHGLIGEPAMQTFGSYFPDATARLCDGTDGIVFGAVSKGGLLELRKHFDFFANLRPVRPSPSLFSASPLKPELLQEVDILFVRELVSGIYFGPSGRSRDQQGNYGYHTMRYYDHEIRRIAKVALEKASARKQVLTVAHKENALPCLSWVQLVCDEARAFPGVQIEPMLVDNLAMQMVRHPQRFDVVLAGNLFGDILSDIGGALVGSIGMLGSASLNAQGFGMYEAIHGTAPDIAQKGIANPFGTLAGIVLMLEQWGELKAAHTIMETQERVLVKGYRTADLCSEKSQWRDRSVSTQMIVDIFCQELAVRVT
ncbi:MAG: isocitrate/isopropylmalate dehydrogenase family protein [Elainellaceae cyanobacterium]